MHNNILSKKEIKYKNKNKIPKPSVSHHFQIFWDFNSSENASFGSAIIVVNMIFAIPRNTLKLVGPLLP